MRICAFFIDKPLSSGLVCWLIYSSPWQDTADFINTHTHTHTHTHTTISAFQWPWKNQRWDFLTYTTLPAFLSCPLTLFSRSGMTVSSESVVSALAKDCKDFQIKMKTRERSWFMITVWLFLKWSVLFFLSLASSDFSLWAKTTYVELQINLKLNKYMYRALWNPFYFFPNSVLFFSKFIFFRLNFSGFLFFPF